MGGTDPSDPEKNRLLDQWKSLVGDVGNIGTRYATANGFYLSVITALLALLAYVGTGKVFEAATYPVIALVAVFAMVVCWIWRKTIEFYGALFGAKFAVLKILEERLPVRVYMLEERELYVTRKAGYLTVHEALVPRLLCWFYGSVAALAVILFFATL